MKKMLMTTALLLTAVMGLQAQSLFGTWAGEHVVNEEAGTQFTIYLTINEGGTGEFSGIGMASIPNAADISFSISFPLTYTRDGNVLNITSEPSKAVAKLDKIEYKGDAIQVVKEKPEVKEEFEKQLNELLTNNLVKEYVNEPPFDGEMTIIKITDTTLVVNDGDDDDIEMTRVK